MGLYPGGPIMRFGGGGGGGGRGRGRGLFSGAGGGAYYHIGLCVIFTVYKSINECFVYDIDQL